MVLLLLVAAYQTNYTSNSLRKQTPPSTLAHATMSLRGKYRFFLSQNAASGPEAAREIKAYLGDEAGLVVVPYFELPPHGEHFEDTEGRFPMLATFEKFYDGSDDTGNRFWFAHVLPEEGKENENTLPEYLTIEPFGGKMVLARRLFNTSERFVATWVE